MAKKELGAITLLRDIRNHRLWQDKPFTKGQAWVDMLLRANHKDKDILIDYETIFLKRGDFFTSKTQLSLDWGWSRGRVIRFLNFLESKEKQIVQKRHSKGYRITICNYNDLQKLPHTASNRHGTGIEQAWNTNKNDKNDKNDKKYIIIYKGEDKKVKLTQDQYTKLINKFGKTVTEEYINRVNDYICQKGKKYKSHYHTILNWIRRNGIDGKNTDNEKYRGIEEEL